MAGGDLKYSRQSAGTFIGENSSRILFSLVLFINIPIIIFLREFYLSDNTIDSSVAGILHASPFSILHNPSTVPVIEEHDGHRSIFSQKVLMLDVPSRFFKSLNYLLNCNF